ncbi:PP2C family protein-serine/threonine phosphatase [Actinoalloteichus hymeniacidonis]|uniref:Serine/threonine protein phosphatase n=1 Tax=Actinoalloteichus hymeniacidonis TaxID=340345 RepID=A0AAC9MYL2_9PSEU|nr:PP2C family protein-serine/threonine phosphatase [Actinoalloteichus hymeniacidonis]AOS63016.1 serine/threonine protein phosphatase [Actinoalloteichus hymeniacidonis]MBB5908949.1 serine/threonine protein phosphatase PrpC [Actinoalloteichus hymeniacidonis]
MAQRQTSVLGDTPTGPACPQCEYVTMAGDLFCEDCGENLGPVLAQTPEPTPAAPPAGTVLCGGCGHSQFTADGLCSRCGRAKPADNDRVEVDLGVVAGVSDRGLRHHHNEDAFGLRTLACPDGTSATIVVVCDGVSSSSRAEDASRVAAYTAAELLSEAVRAGSETAEATRRAVRAATESVARLHTDAADRDPPSCTYVSAVVTETEVTIGWVGDSRAYWLALPEPESTMANFGVVGGADIAISSQAHQEQVTEVVAAGGSACLTLDHSWARQMVSTGEMTELQIQGDRRAPALCRWLGADSDGRPAEVVRFRPSGPGIVLVCTDGLWHYLGDPTQTATRVAALGDPFNAARELTSLALRGGGHDNITVALVPFPLGNASGRSA